MSEPAEIESFWRNLVAATGGLVIIDFLDNANWDYFTDVKYEPSTGVLRVVWRDYAGRHMADLTRDVFPGDMYGFFMRLQSVRVVARGSLVLFMLRGYTVREKEIAALLKTDVDEYQVDKESLFRRTVYKRNSNHWEVWDCHVAPLYSVAILPKGVGASSWQANLLLYLENLGVADDELIRHRHNLAALPPSASTEIAVRANAIRRVLESVLKIECAYREIHPAREYPELKLGDLVSALKKGRTEEERRKLNHVVRVLNEYSHDSGFPIIKADITAVADMVIDYVRLLGSEVATKLSPAA